MIPYIMESWINVFSKDQYRRFKKVSSVGGFRGIGIEINRDSGQLRIAQKPRPHHGDMLIFAFCLWEIIKGHGDKILDMR